MSKDVLSKLKNLQPRGEAPPLPSASDPAPEPQPEPQKPLAKSKDPNYKKTSVYFRRSLMPKLKAVAESEGLDVSEFVAQVVEAVLQDRAI